MKKSATRLYAVSIIIIAIVGAGLTAYSVLTSISSQKKFLQQRVAGLASAVPRDTILKLPGKEEDADTKEYAEIKKTMQDIAAVNPDIRFIYVTKERDNTIYFVADSEPAGSEDESPPGQSYDEVDPLYQGYTRRMKQPSLDLRVIGGVHGSRGLHQLSKTEKL